MFTCSSVCVCVWWCSSIDGLGEWLHGDSDDDSPGWGRRETVWSLLAWRGILPLPHLWGVCETRCVCVSVCLSWSVTMVCVSIRWTWFRSTSGAMTSWFVVSTWRTSRPRRPAHSPSSTSWAGLPRASPPPHAPYWTSAGTAWTLNAGLFTRHEMGEKIDWNREFDYWSFSFSVSKTL